VDSTTAVRVLSLRWMEDLDCAGLERKDQAALRDEAMKYTQMVEKGLRDGLESSQLAEHVYTAVQTLRWSLEQLGGSLTAKDSADGRWAKDMLSNLSMRAVTRDFSPNPFEDALQESRSFSQEEWVAIAQGARATTNAMGGGSSPGVVER
jgi:hypothetical protein